MALLCHAAWHKNGGIRPYPAREEPVYSYGCRVAYVPTVLVVEIKRSGKAWIRTTKRIRRPRRENRCKLRYRHRGYYGSNGPLQYDEEALAHLSTTLQPDCYSSLLVQDDPTACYPTGRPVTENLVPRTVDNLRKRRPGHPLSGHVGPRRASHETGLVAHTVSACPVFLFFRLLIVSRMDDE